MKALFITLFTCISSFLYSQSEYNPIYTAASFLLLSPDARAEGMGSAGCASFPDVNSAFWNPAKLSFIKKRNGFHSSYTRDAIVRSSWGIFDRDNQSFDFSGYKKIKNKNAMSISGRYFLWDDIIFTDIVGNPIGIFRPREFFSSISYAQFVSKKFSIGITIKYIHSNLTDGIIIGGVKTRTGRSVAEDISCYWRNDTALTTKSVFAWGVNISNIGEKISYSSTGTKSFLPANLSLGLSYQFNFDTLNSIEFICDANKLLVPTPPIYDWTTGSIISGKDPDRSVVNALYTSFYDAPGGFKEELNELYLASGIEGRIFNIVFLRTGYFYEHETKGGRKFFTFGIGLKYWGIGLDGSYVLPTKKTKENFFFPLKNTWRASLSWEFDGFRKKKD